MRKFRDEKRYDCRKRRGIQADWSSVADGGFIKCPICAFPLVAVIMSGRCGYRCKCGDRFTGPKQLDTLDEKRYDCRKREGVA